MAWKQQLATPGDEAEVGLDPVEGREDQLTKSRPDSGKRGRCSFFSLPWGIGWLTVILIEQNTYKHPHPFIDSSMMLTYAHMVELPPLLPW